MSNLPSAADPGTISDGPGFYYFTNPNNTPTVDSSGNVSADLPTPALPVPGDNAGITGISSTDLVKASDIAATLMPYLAYLAGLSPQARLAITGASALWSMYENYYNTDIASSSGSCSGTVCTTAYAACQASISSSLGTGYSVDTSTLPGSCYTSNGIDAGWGPYSFSSSSSTSTAPSAPTLAQTASMLAQNATNSLTALQDMPASNVAKIPMTQLLHGPSSATGPTSTSTSTDSSGNTTTTSSTPSYNIGYNGNQAQVTPTVQNVTKVCTSTGSCTTTNTASQPIQNTPFVAPTVSFASSGLSAALSGMQQTTPFANIGFGSAWLPQSCPPAPTWNVQLPFGYNQTYTLPTSYICDLAGDMKPVVLGSGGILSLMILAW
ncbi:MAG: hypothetical protein ACYDA7_00225 [Acidithiobacillus sp.]